MLSSHHKGTGKMIQRSTIKVDEDKSINSAAMVVVIFLVIVKVSNLGMIFNDDPNDFVIQYQSILFFTISDLVLLHSSDRSADFVGPRTRVASVLLHN
ncbi:hypothetical protein L1987_45525 [Smallanthus sonchifolius]|uniref:Uncharacterized protein n=1 Tax=Smallanthus sonchifolius TaxID=185202 RepID=A0ACB9FX13_9ASTR|nr:hypothetical protein L1987_45525 [Smallanthus sonchifolius]